MRSPLRCSHRSLLVTVLLLNVVLCAPRAQSFASDSPTTNAEEGLQPIKAYIASGWQTLTRAMTRCDSVVDPKVAAPPVMYLPADMQIPPAVQKLQADCKVQVKHLPEVIRQPGQLATTKFDPHGLLFLENSYVVPGGRFNEMYGWDSYFILLGLIRDGKLDLARGMVENFFFEIEHYGTVLNANRTYFLSRSQPPFLTSMIMAVYDAHKTGGHPDRSWLARAYSYASQDYEMWNREPHVAGSTGLSRYFDFGEGPVAEGLQDETGFYRTVTTYFLRHPEEAAGELAELKSAEGNPEAVGFTFTLQLCEAVASGQKCDPFRMLTLTRDYYKGDRSMRESGFDISFRFGPYSARTHHYAPVCLNSLLYKSETDLAKMAELLGKKDDAAKWQGLAQQRKQRINQYLWDQERGRFFDYDFDKQQRSTYDYASTFYPLWAGLATQEQAASVEKSLAIFEQPGGVAMSHTETGAQWDLPYGWAPIQLLTIGGLRRYGFTADADRLSYKFLSTVAENFKRDGTIREKYNVVTRSSETHVTTGYQANVVGFGWTNGVFLELLHDLPKEAVARLAEEQGSSAARK
jgi:alpha,alpha-trehalase